MMMRLLHNRYFIYSLFFVLSTTGAEPNAPYPPLSSGYDLLVINRRFVSHIAFDPDGRHLTLIVTHGPVYHAFHAMSHPLHYYCHRPATCLNEATKLDSHLTGGYNIGLALDGSVITKIVYLLPDSSRGSSD